MKTTKIYLIRHGESLANAQDLFIGHVDMDLSETGYAQARRTAEYLKDVPLDAVYASDLCRAYHTALPTAELHGLTVVQDPLLREIESGLWENTATPDLPRRFAESYGIWKTDIGHARPDGGESVLEMQARFCGRLEALLPLHQGQSVAIFTHATPIRACAAYWKGLSADAMQTVPWATNASVTVGEWDGTAYRLLEYSTDSFLGDLYRGL